MHLALAAVALLCLVCRFYVLPIQSRLIPVSFGDKAEYLIGPKNFRAWTTGRVVQINKGIDKTKALSNITNLHKGLEKMFDVYQPNKQREFADNILIVFTDRKTHNASAVEEVLKLKVMKSCMQDLIQLQLQSEILPLIQVPLVLSRPQSIIICTRSRIGRSRLTGHLDGGDDGKDA